MDIKDIDGINPFTVKQMTRLSKNKLSNQNKHSSSFEQPSKQSSGHADALLESITAEQMDERLIRKMPHEEYLHLLALLDELISGSIDDEV